MMMIRLFNEQKLRFGDVSFGSIKSENLPFIVSRSAAESGEMDKSAEVEPR